MLYLNWQLQQRLRDDPNLQHLRSCSRNNWIESGDDWQSLETYAGFASHAGTLAAIRLMYWDPTSFFAWQELHLQFMLDLYNAGFVPHLYPHMDQIRYAIVRNDQHSVELSQVIDDVEVICHDLQIEYNRNLNAACRMVGRYLLNDLHLCTEYFASGGHNRLMALDQRYRTMGILNDPECPPREVVVHAIRHMAAFRSIRCSIRFLHALREIYGSKTGLMYQGQSAECRDIELHDMLSLSVILANESQSLIRLAKESKGGSFVRLDNKQLLAAAIASCHKMYPCERDRFTSRLFDAFLAISECYENYPLDMLVI